MLSFLVSNDSVGAPNSMICIEFIGCTGAGKSTLVNKILQVCARDGIDARLGEDFLLSQFHLSWVSNSKAQAVLINLISLLVALITWGKYRYFYHFAFQTIDYQPISWHQKLYLGRNILKIIGIYEMARRRAHSGQIILLDEGPLHSANALFVHVSVTLSDAELSEFVRTVPFPDAVIYLRGLKDILIQRTLARGHKRIRKEDQSEVERFVKSATDMFERLVQEPAVQDKLFIVNDCHIRLPQCESIYQKLIPNLIQAGLNESHNEP